MKNERANAADQMIKLFGAHAYFLSVDRAVAALIQADVEEFLFWRRVTDEIQYRTMPVADSTHMN